MADAAASGDNPYGLMAMLKEGDFVSRGVFFVLMLMSAVSWYVIITKALDQAALRKQADAAEKDFWASSSLSDGVSRL